VQAYYDIHTNMFIYLGGGGVWVHRTYLPTRYRTYDLYSGYKVVMTDYRGEAPYSNFNEYKTKYVRGYKGGAQKTIGARPSKGNSGAKESNGAVKSNKSVSPPRSKSVAPAGNKSASPAKNNGGGKGKKNN
jgi:hypothetical protein